MVNCPLYLAFGAGYLVKNAMKSTDLMLIVFLGAEINAIGCVELLA